MKISVSDSLNNKSDVELFHDVDGNIFFRIDNSEYYYLCISSSDDLELVEVENFNSLVNTENKVKYENIKNTSDEKSLRGKIIKKIDDNEDDNEYSDDEIVNEDYFKYYPEDKNYYVERSEQSDDEDNDIKFLFSKSGDDSVLECLTKTLDVLANYDTLIIDDLNKLILSTLECNEKSDYRVKILLTGVIELSIIGSKIKKYKPIFSYENDKKKLSLQKILDSAIE